MKDSIGLLKAEIAKEEAHLADEKKSLQEMDKNAKRAEAERKRQMKNVRGDFVLQQQLLLKLFPRNTLYSASWMTFPRARMRCLMSLHFSTPRAARYYWKRYVLPQ